MSHRASSYALKVCRDDPNLTSGERAVLYAVAAAANVRTSRTFTGDWLCEATGLTSSQLWRVFKVLTARGYVSLEHRPGKSSVVGFPVFGFIAEAELGGRTDAGGQWHPAFCGCPDCLEATG